MYVNSIITLFAISLCNCLLFPFTAFTILCSSMNWPLSRTLWSFHAYSIAHLLNQLPVSRCACPSLVSLFAKYFIHIQHIFSHSCCWELFDIIQGVLLKSIFAKNTFGTIPDTGEYFQQKLNGFQDDRNRRCYALYVTFYPVIVLFLTLENIFSLSEIWKIWKLIRATFRSNFTRSIFEYYKSLLVAGMRARLW